MNKDNFIFLDVETGGLIPSEHSLLQVGYLIVNKEDKSMETEFNIKKKKYAVTHTAMAFNGINLSDIHRIGFPERDVMAQLQQHVMEWCDTPPIIIGHNVGFDVSFIKEAFKNADLDYEETFSHRNIDTMTILKYLNLIGVLPDSVLSSRGANAYFNIENLHEHNALSDAKSTAKLFYKLIELGKERL